MLKLAGQKQKVFVLEVVATLCLPLEWKVIFFSSFFLSCSTIGRYLSSWHLNSTTVVTNERQEKCACRIVVWAFNLLVRSISVSSVCAQVWKNRERSAWVENREFPSSVQQTGERTGCRSQMKQSFTLAYFSLVASQLMIMLFVFLLCSFNKTEGQELRKRKKLVLVKIFFLL